MVKTFTISCGSWCALLAATIFCQNGISQGDIPTSFPTDYITQFQDIYADDIGLGYVVGKCGVLRKTEDAGQNWMTQASPTDADIFSITCAPNDCSRALMTTHQSMYRLENDTWTDVTYDGLNDAGQLHWLTANVVVHETTGKEYYRSPDGGLTWTKVEFNDFQQANMWFLENGNGYILIDGELFNTSNHWVTIESRGYTHPVSVREMTWLDENNGWIFDADKLFHGTKDGGTTWTLLNAKSQLTSVNWMVALSDTQLVGAQITTSRIESLDGGVTWTRASFLQDGNRRVNEKFHRQGDAFYLVGNQSQLLYSESGFTDFVELDQFERQPTIAPIAFATNDVGYALSSGNVLVTTDAGATWTSKPLPLTGRDLNVLDNGSVVVLTGATSYISTDQGTTFDQWIPDAVIPDNEGPFTFGRKPNGDIYLMSQNYGYLSTDGGQNFSSINVGQDFRPSDIYFLNDNNGYAAGRQSNYMYTKDGGQTWTVGSGPANNSVDVFFLDENNGWVSDARTRWTTNDRGMTWTSASSTGGYDMIRHPVDGSILSARFGSGNVGELGRSTDDGATWTNIAGNCYPYRSAAITPDGKYYFTGGDGFIVRHDLAALTTSTRELRSLPIESLVAFPNPTAGEVTLAIPNPRVRTVVRVYNSQGRLVQQINVEAGQREISASIAHLPAGMYTMQWLSEDRIGISRMLKI